MSNTTTEALDEGLRATKQALRSWKQRPLPVIGRWLLASALAAAVLLVFVLVVGEVASSRGPYELSAPPFTVGGPSDVLYILRHNLLVLALHSFACVAGFIAGSSLPHQASGLRGINRAVHERGGRLAIGFVAAATTFSLVAQAVTIGISDARVSAALGTSPALLLVALLPHAIPELCALFLPLAAWLLAARRGAWDELLAASMVSTVVALPILVVCACWEVYVAPHVVTFVVGRA